MKLISFVNYRQELQTGYPSVWVSIPKGGGNDERKARSSCDFHLLVVSLNNGAGGPN